jgi:hypothetical protein
MYFLRLDQFHRQPRLSYPVNSFFCNGYLSAIAVVKCAICGEPHNLRTRLSAVQALSSTTNFFRILHANIPQDARNAVEMENRKTLAISTYVLSKQTGNDEELTNHYTPIRSRSQWSGSPPYTSDVPNSPPAHS